MPISSSEPRIRHQNVESSRFLQNPAPEFRLWRKRGQPASVLEKRIHTDPVWPRSDPKGRRNLADWTFNLIEVNCTCVRTTTSKHLVNCCPRVQGRHKLSAIRTNLPLFSPTVSHLERRSVSYQLHRCRLTKMFNCGQKGLNWSIGHNWM